LFVAISPAGVFSRSYEKAGGTHDAYGLRWSVEGFYVDTDTGDKRPESTARKVAAMIA
jgi:hypothetical protein